MFSITLFSLNWNLFSMYNVLRGIFIYRESKYAQHALKLFVYLPILVQLSKPLLTQKLAHILNWHRNSSIRYLCGLTRCETG